MSAPIVDSLNSSLIQDDLLLQLVQVVEGDYPIGPSFLHAFGTVVEAAVLHETNYFGPLAGCTDGRATGLQSRVQASPLIWSLAAGGALRAFPAPDDVDLRLEQLGMEHRMIDLVADLNETLGSAAFEQIEAESCYFRSFAQLLADFPGVFDALDLVDDDDEPVLPEAAALLARGGSRSTRCSTSRVRTTGSTGSRASARP